MNSNNKRPSLAQVSKSSITSPTSHQNLSTMPNFKRSGTYVIEKSPSNENSAKTLTRPKVDPIPTPPITNSKSKLSRIPSLTRKNEQPSSANSQQSSTSSIETISLTSSINNQETKTSKTQNSLSLIKEKKRAELKKVDSPSEPAQPLPRNIELALKNARRSGQLNLSDFSLGDVPSKVWHLNTQDFGVSKSTTIEYGEANEFKWWEQVDLNKLILASNKIKVITKDVQNLNSLVSLDVRICLLF
jgi:hypothetical protein